MTTRPIIAYEHTCERCGHVWRTKLKDPVRCQSDRCKSPNWRTKAAAGRGAPKGSGRKLTETQRVAVLSEYQKGNKTLRGLGGEFGVSRTTIQNVIKEAGR